MNNREKRTLQDKIHLYLAFQRKTDGQNACRNCIRMVIRDEKEDLKVFETKLRAIGGYWRVHKTVNARNPRVAMQNLMKVLIDHPEKASIIETEWRTALLQPNAKAERFFMLDVDTEDESLLSLLEYYINERAWVENVPKIKLTIKKIKSPNGWHYITHPFDTREICKLDYVSLLRDGYYFIKEIK